MAVVQLFDRQLVLAAQLVLTRRQDHRPAHPIAAHQDRHALGREDARVAVGHHRRVAGLEHLQQVGRPRLRAERPGRAAHHGELVERGGQVAARLLRLDPAHHRQGVGEAGLVHHVALLGGVRAHHVADEEVAAAIQHVHDGPVAVGVARVLAVEDAVRAPGLGGGRAHALIGGELVVARSAALEVEQEVLFRTRNHLEGKRPARSLPKDAAGGILTGQHQRGFVLGKRFDRASIGRFGDVTA